MCTIKETFISIFLISTGFQTFLFTKILKYDSQKDIKLQCKTFFSITWFLLLKHVPFLKNCQFLIEWMWQPNKVVNQGNNNKILGIKLLLCTYVFIKTYLNNREFLYQSFCVLHCSRATKKEKEKIMIQLCFFYKMPLHITPSLIIILPQMHIKHMITLIFFYKLLFSVIVF